MLADLLMAVEKLGRWPVGLRAADVVLLPKPGGSLDEPLQRRPITLLPVIYRLWARLRLPAVDAWRAGWDPVAAEAPKGPDGLACGLPWDLACSEALGQDLCGMAVDMTKCYDSVRHPVLRRALPLAGPQPWPGPSWTPTLPLVGSASAMQSECSRNPFLASRQGAR